MTERIIDMTGRNDLKYWGDKFRNAHGKSVTAILEQAAVVVEALATDLTQSAYAEEIGRSRQTVTQYASIGNDPRLASITSNLPTSSYSIYLASCLTDDQLAQVHPDMTQAEMLALKPSTRHDAHTGEIEHYTPSQYIEAARRVMGGIDLDPASCEDANKVVRAERFYDLSSDGLSQEWNGRVWLNPPYSQPAVSNFVHKLLSHCALEDVSQAILLTNNATDTGWWHDAAQMAGAVCFTRRRISFISADGEVQPSNTNGQTFFYFGNAQQTFVEEFGAFGVNMQLIDGLPF